MQQLSVHLRYGVCALGAVTAAFLAAADDGGDLTAAAAATAVYTIAAQQAAAVSAGPGSFAPAFLDALTGLSAEDIHNLLVTA